MGEQMKFGEQGFTESITIFPYSAKHSAFARHQRLMKNMRISHLVSPKGWGLTGEMVETPCGNIVVDYDFAGALANSSVVWFVDDDHISLPQGCLEDKLRETVAARRKIIFTRRAGDYALGDLAVAIPEELNVTGSVFGADCLGISEERQKLLFDIDVPIVTVLGTAENTDKFEVQAALHEQFAIAGYMASTVASRTEGEILGIHSYPRFMFDPAIDAEEKILRYNGLLKRIELRERPDVMILGVPGGVFQFSRKRNNRFGAQAFYISRAIKSDCAVLCSLYSDFVPSYFEDISVGIRNRLDIDVRHHHVAARMAGAEEAYQAPDDFNYITLDGEFVSREIKRYEGAGVCNLLCRGETERLAESIIANLAGNAVTPV
jgi:peptide maturation system protein (TIGR04066 family)